MATQARVFERFERTSTRSPAKAVVTVTSRGVLSLSRPAWQLLGDASHVVLLFDRASQVLGVQGAPAEDPDAYRVSPTSGNPERGPGLVAARLALEHFGVDMTASRRWRAELVAGVLEVPVGEPGTPVTSNRAMPAPADS